MTGDQNVSRDWSRDINVHRDWSQDLNISCDWSQDINISRDWSQDINISRDWSQDINVRTFISSFPISCRFLMDAPVTLFPNSSVIFYKQAFMCLIV
jgi:hypothetical protein